MNDFSNMYLINQKVSREAQRLQLEREHPDGLSRHEIREALDDGQGMRIRVQTIISNIRQTSRLAPSRHAFSEPTCSHSPQA